MVDHRDHRVGEHSMLFSHERADRGRCAASSVTTEGAKRHYTKLLSVGIPERGQCNLLQCGPMFAQIGANPGPTLPRFRPNSADAGPKALEFSRNQASCAQSRTISTKIDQTWPEIGQSRLISARNRFGPQQDCDWRGTDQFGFSEIGQIRPKLARYPPSLARCRPNLGHPGRPLQHMQARENKRKNNSKIWVDMPDAGWSCRGLEGVRLE